MRKKISTLSLPGFFLILAATLLTLSGCLPLNSTEATDNNGHAPEATAKVEFEPYYPADFRDLKIPGELVWNMEKSVVLNTNSFKGGNLNFNGRVEVTSLMEFFANSMKNDGWTSVGSLKSKSVLLAFTKENSSCMIKIVDGGPIGKTDVNIYIAYAN